MEQAEGSPQTSKVFANFDIDSMARGFQLTIVGAVRALQNPKIRKFEYYRVAALCIALGVALQLIISVPILAVKIGFRLASFFVDLEAATWDDQVVQGLDFIANSVLQLPLFLMNLLHHFSPFLDQIFMESLEWVDITYSIKHHDDASDTRQMYYTNLQLYSSSARVKYEERPRDKLSFFLYRYSRRALMSLVIYALSFIPYLGKTVIPLVSFLTFRKAVGLAPAILIFGVGIVLPKRYLVVFLQSFFASRSFVRQMLEPYFSRIHFGPEQKRKFFRDREGVLFGFGIGFLTLLRIPLFGVLIYVIAEASTAFLVTKITDPPPPPMYHDHLYQQYQTRASNPRSDSSGSKKPGKKFT